MAENSKIEWTDHTFNPWVGCQKVSPGCDHCYAEGWSKRSGMVQWGPHGERKRTSVANWKKPYKWNAEAKASGVRRKVFSASLADWLDNRADQEWRVLLARLIADTPDLDWLLLTKRIENFARLSPWGSSIPFPSNVWLGVTAEDQERYDQRWTILSKIPATVRFISYEPAIGPIIDLYSMSALPDWVIMGGESGHGARHMEEGWAHYLRTYCAGLRIPFFFKQMTGKKPIPDGLLIREFPRAA